MDFIKLTGKTIDMAFREFHRKNPNVYAKFKELALQAVHNGKRKISFKLIMNVIRWEVFMKTEDRNFVMLDGEPVRFKINDAYGSRYARLFAKEFPEYENCLQMRKLRS